MSSSVKTSQPVQSAPEDLAKSMQSGLASIMAAPQKVAEANYETIAEVLSFISRRLKAQAELVDGLGRCRDFDQVAETQRKFFDVVSKDYTNELDHLGRIAQKNLAVLGAAASDSVNKGKRQ